MDCPIAKGCHLLGFNTDASLREHITQARHLTMCLALLMIPLFHFYIPPVFVLGFALFGVDMFLGGWQMIDWRKCWPLFFPLAFWLFSLIGVTWCTDVPEGWLQVKLRALFAIGPFLAIGLAPRKSWGTSIIIGTLILIMGVLICGTIYSIENGRIFVYPNPEEGITIPWMLKNNYFGYDNQGKCLRLIGKRFYNYPNAIAFHVIVSIALLTHRTLYRLKELRLSARLGRVALIGFLLFFLLITNTRAAMMGFMGGVAYVMFELVFVKRWLNLWGKLGIVALGIGLIVALLGLSRFNVTSVSYWSNTSFMEHVKENPRYHAWTRTWNDRSSYLPLGTGTGGSCALLKSYYATDDILAYDQMSKVHNHYLEALVEWGYIGFIFVICMMFWPLLWWRRFTLYHKFLWISFWILHLFESIVQDSRYVPFLALYYLMWSLWYVHGGVKSKRLSLSDI